MDDGLAQKARKAKQKLRKKDGENRPEGGSLGSFYFGGVDQSLGGPRGLGAPGGLPGGGGHRGIGGLSIGFPFNGQRPLKHNKTTLFLGKSSLVNDISVSYSFLMLIT